MCNFYDFYPWAFMLIVLGSAVLGSTIAWIMSL